LISSEEKGRKKKKRGKHCPIHYIFVQRQVMNGERRGGRRKKRESVGRLASESGEEKNDLRA